MTKAQMVYNRLVSKAEDLLSILREAGEAFAHLIFPPRCVLCERLSATPICEPCKASLPLVRGNTCSKCGKPTLYEVNECRECRGRALAFSGLVAVGSYEGALKETIHALKYGNGKRLAVPLAELIAERLDGEFARIDHLAFVPMAKAKRLKRGYNQAQLLAECLGGIIGKQVVQPLRRSGMRSQSGLALSDRRENVRRAFSAIRPVEGRILLVDDVYTTGNTADACARELVKAGADAVLVACVARTVAGRK